MSISSDTDDGVFDVPENCGRGLMCAQSCRHPELEPNAEAMTRFGRSLAVFSNSFDHVTELVADLRRGDWARIVVSLSPVTSPGTLRNKNSGNGAQKRIDDARKSALELIDSDCGGPGWRTILDGDIDDTMIGQYLDSEEIRIKTSAERRGSSAKDTSPEGVLRDAFYHLYTTQQAARFCLAVVAVEQPALLQASFSQPTEVDGLPHKLKELFFLDLRRKRGSILAKVLKDTTTTFYTDQSDMSRFMLEIGENGASAVRPYILGIKAVQHAIMPGVTCDMNDGGHICVRLLDAIDSDDIPPDVLRIMRRAMQAQAAQRLALWEGVASNKILLPSIYEIPDHVVDRQIAPTEPTVSKRQTRRASNLANRERLGDVPEINNRSIEIPYDKIRVAIKSGNTTDVVTCDISDDVQAGIKALIDYLMETDIVVDYLRQYPGMDGLPDAMRNALRAIVLPQIYDSEQASIRRVSDSKVWVTHDGITERVYRFSGANLHGGGGGKLGRGTRIVFTRGSTGDNRRVRTITIHRIFQKDGHDKYGV